MGIVKKILVIFGMILVFNSCQKQNAESTDTDTNSNEQGMNIKGVDSPTIEDLSEAYAILMADNVNHWGLEVDIEIFRKAFLRHVGKDISEDDVSTAEFIYSYAVNEANERRIASLKEKNEAFIENNAKKPGIQTFESGLQLEVIKEGTGIMPQENWSCKLHYVGTFIDGKEFDNSKEVQNGEPVVFDLESVIPAWQEGLTHMRVGGTYKLYVPYDLAYGVDGVRTDRAEIIPPYSALIFEIELIDAMPGRTGGRSPLQE